MSRRDDLVVAVNRIIGEYAGMRLTLRQIYYRLVAAQVFPNRVSSYKLLSDVLARAREKGQVPWDAIEDRTREIHDGYGEDRNAPDHFNIFWNYIRDMDKKYEMPRWHGQPTKVFVMLEKEALYEVFREITDAEGIDLVPLRGYSSVTLLNQFSERLQAFGGDDRSLRILYFGDFDPSGENIEESAADTLREYGADFEIERIAITEDQIAEYDIPPAPAKTTDSRYAAFEARHGEAIQVELDAIEPRTLQGFIRDAISEYWDEDAAEVRETELARRRERIRGWLEAALNPNFRPPRSDDL